MTGGVLREIGMGRRVAVERGTQGLPGQVEAWGGTRYRRRDSESGE